MYQGLSGFSGGSRALFRIPRGNETRTWSRAESAVVVQMEILPAMVNCFSMPSYRMPWLLIRF